MERPAVVHYFGHERQTANPQIIFKGHIFISDARLFDIKDALAVVLAKVKRYQAVLALNLILRPVGRLFEFGSMQQHKRVGAQAAYAGIQYLFNSSDK